MVAPLSTHHHHESTHPPPASELAGGSQLNQILAGAFAGCSTRFLTQPFDVLKIRFQLQVEPVGSYRSRFLARHAASARAATQATIASERHDIKVKEQIANERLASKAFIHANPDDVGSTLKLHKSVPIPESGTMKMTTPGVTTTTTTMTTGAATATAAGTGTATGTATGATGTATVTSKYTSIIQACRLIYKEEGLLAFWKGHNAGQLMSISYAVFQFWSYEQFNGLLAQLPYLGHHHYVTSFISGGLAGSVGTCVSMPFDVIRTRLVAQDHGAGYRSIPHAIPIIIRTEGIRGLFRGLGTTLVQIGPLVGGNFVLYNSLNDFASQILHHPDHHVPTWVHLLNGGVAGSLSKAITYPLDFIKKRLQVQGFQEQRRSFGKQHVCTGIRDCIQLTIREEGVLGFYKGMTPTLLKSGIQTALYFSIYDECKSFLNKHTGW